MASIDLSDAFYSIPLHPTSRKYATFHFNNHRYAFNVLPFGLTTSLRVFCKMLRPFMIHLRTQGLKTAAYMDAIFIR